jgi:hypothetical protein
MQTPIQRHTKVRKENVKISCIGLSHLSPILILLFKHSRKCEGVRKFVSENLSYIFVFGRTNEIEINGLGCLEYRH